MKRGVHEPLSPDKTLQRIEDLAAGKARVPNRFDIKEDFVLRGAVYCTDGENPMTISSSKSGTGKRHTYYMCFEKGCLDCRKSTWRDVTEDESIKLVKSLQPTQGLFKTAATIFEGFGALLGK